MSSLFSAADQRSEVSYYMYPVWCRCHDVLAVSSIPTCMREIGCRSSLLFGQIDARNDPQERSMRRISGTPGGCTQPQDRTSNSGRSFPSARVSAAENAGDRLTRVVALSAFVARLLVQNREIGLQCLDRKTDRYNHERQPIFKMVKLMVLFSCPMEWVDQTRLMRMWIRRMLRQ